MKERGDGERSWEDRMALLLGLTAIFLEWKQHSQPVRGDPDGHLLKKLTALILNHGGERR